jgi:hypothetical protein
MGRLRGAFFVKVILVIVVIAFGFSAVSRDFMFITLGVSFDDNKYHDDMAIFLMLFFLILLTYLYRIKK